MERSIKTIQASTQITHSLESYRRLVELQKEMIRLAQQNERARRECSELRERVVIEVIGHMKAHRSGRQNVNEALKKSSSTATSNSNLVSLVEK
jgi:hypothetical protein